MRLLGILSGVCILIAGQFCHSCCFDINDFYISADPVLLQWLVFFLSNYCSYHCMMDVYCLWSLYSTYFINLLRCFFPASTVTLLSYSAGIMNSICNAYGPMLTCIYVNAAHNWPVCATYAAQLQGKNLVNIDRHRLLGGKLMVNILHRCNVCHEDKLAMRVSSV